MNEFIFFSYSELSTFLIHDSKEEWKISLPNGQMIVLDIADNNFGIQASLTTVEVANKPLSVIIRPEDNLVYSMPSGLMWRQPPATDRNWTRQLDRYRKALRQFRVPTVEILTLEAGEGIIYPNGTKILSDTPHAVTNLEDGRKKVTTGGWRYLLLLEEKTANIRYVCIMRGVTYSKDFNKFLESFLGYEIAPKLVSVADMGENSYLAPNDHWQELLNLNPPEPFTLGRDNLTIKWNKKYPDDPKQARLQNNGVIVANINHPSIVKILTQWLEAIKTEKKIDEQLLIAV